MSKIVRKQDRASLVVHMVNNSSAMQETWVQSPGDENSYPLQHSCLENPTDRGAWPAIVLGSHNESETT